MNAGGSFLLRPISPRPLVPAGWDFVSASVSAGGQGLFLFIGDDAEGDVGARDSSGAFPSPRMPTAKPFKLAIVGSGETTWVDLPPLDVSFPRAELFPDGRILLAAARSVWRGPDDFDRNGVIFDPKTQAVTRVLLGDGIADVAVDGAGRIWVSYFDEGVFGNFGWNHPGPSGPGAGGLVCFTDDGEVRWRFNREDGDAFVDDCYAMNATREAIWIFYYSDFQICRVGMDFSQTFYTPHGLAGSHALVVSDAAILLSKQYREAPDRFHLMRRIDGGLTQPEPMIAQLPDGGSIERAQIVGRGDTLNVITEDGWFQTSLAELL